MGEIGSLPWIGLQTVEDQALAAEAFQSSARIVFCFKRYDWSLNSV